MRARLRLVQEPLHANVMIRLLVVGVLALALPLSTSRDAARSAYRTESPQDAPVALVGVQVVTMTSEVVLPDQTVLIRDGRIAAIGPRATTPVPSGAFVVPGSATTHVLPGLIDSHVHLFDAGELLLYLANGITAVRNLHGVPTHLAWRREILAGERLGPRFYTAGPILDGDPPTRGTNVVLRTPDSARAEVARQAALGFDQIKLYDNVPPAIYQAIIDEARRHGLDVAGHVPTPVGLAGLVAAGGQRIIEHAEELLPFLGGGDPAAPVDSIARVLASAGIIVDPTAVVYQSAWDQAVDLAAVRSRPEMRYANPATQRTWGWDGAARNFSTNPRARGHFERATTYMRDRLIPALHRAGVTLVAGSDAPIPALVPGFALHDELRFFARAGLTPYEVLRTATVNAAVLLREPALGTVTPGAIANLLVVEGNPLASLDALQARQGVVLHGRWLNQADLDRRIDSLAATYAAAGSAER